MPEQNDQEETILDGVESTGEATQPQNTAAETPVADDQNNPHRNDPETPINTPPEEGQGNQESGERPEWLPEKFNSPEELAKAYNELGSTIRGKFELPEGFDSPEELAKAYNELKEQTSSTQAPESYELELPEGFNGLTDQDEQMFREAGLTNEQAQKLVDKFHETVLPAMREKQVELEKERLGRQWQLDPSDRQFTSRLEQVKTWAENNLPSEVVSQLAQSSNGVNALYQMMQSGIQGRMMDGQTSGTARMTQAELDSMVQDERYWTDPAYRQDVERRLGLRN